MGDINDNISQNGINEVNGAGSRRGSNTSSRSSRSKASKAPVPDAFNKELLVHPLDKKFTCLKCNEILREPVQIKECGHRLCYHCYEDIRCDGPHCCPEDQIEIDKDTVPDIDKAFKKDVESLEVKCEHPKCKWEGKLAEYQAHLQTCEECAIQCENDCGVEYKRGEKIQGKTMTSGQEKHLDKCVKAIITCTYCNDRFFREDQEDHLDDCPDRPISCPNKCDKVKKFKRKELEKHMQEDCNRTKISCDFEDVCCDHKASREKMLKHYTKEITNHVKLLHDTLMKHDLQLQQVVQTVETHDQRFDVHDQRIGDLEKIANSQLIWRIDEYSNKLKAAQSGESMTLYSPGFITSKHGYRLSASVCLDGDGKGKGKNMSVFICILKGPYDALLKWPFESRVTFTLLDQHPDPTQRKHLQSSITPPTIPENMQYLGRPYKTEKNASFGAAKFAKHEDIESRNYIKDDTLFLKIGVEGNSEPVVST